VQSQQDGGSGPISQTARPLNSAFSESLNENTRC